LACAALASACAGAEAQAEPYVYAADLAGGVAQLDASGGALTPLTPPAVGGPNAQVVATSPDGEDVYTAGSAIGQYDVGVNGALTPKTPATVPSGGFNIGIAVSPDGSSAYVTDYMADSVRQFDIAADGTLSPKAQAAVATATEPTGVAISPDGENVYVASFNTDVVSQFDVGADGSLSPKTPATVASGGGPIGVLVGPDSDSVYVLNQSDDTVSQYDAAADGTLTPKASPTVPTGINPRYGTITADGRSAYIANQTDNSVWQYDVGADGALSSMPTPAVSAGNTTFAVASVGDGVFAASQGDGAVYQFGAGPDGALSPRSPAFVTVPGPPGGLAVTSDNTAPSVSIASPADGASFAQGESVAADYACSDDTALASCTGTVADGAPLVTATAGDFAFTVTAVDRAGNIASRTVRYRVTAAAPGTTQPPAAQSPAATPPAAERCESRRRITIRVNRGGRVLRNVVVRAGGSG
jgi:6-phosphogluconolactonase